MDVGHIPLSIRENPPVGYYSYFTNANAIASASAGIYSPEFDKTTIENSAAAKMVDDISWLLSRDINVGSRETATQIDILNSLAEAGAVEEAQVLVSSCYYKNDQCGKTEFQYIEDSHMSYVDNKHQLAQGGCCMVCAAELETRLQPSLLMSIPDMSDGQFTFMTPYLRKNVGELAKKFAGKKLLLSRLRETNLDWNGYNIDNDFGNYSSLYLAINKTKEKSLYFASSNTSLALLGMMAVAKSLSPTVTADIMALPKTTFVDQEGNSAATTIDELRNKGVSSIAINLVLLQTLGSSSANLSLSSREFGMMERRLSSRVAIDAALTNSAKIMDAEETGRLTVPNRQIINQVTKELMSPGSKLDTSRKNTLAVGAVRSILKSA